MLLSSIRDLCFNPTESNKLMSITPLVLECFEDAMGVRLKRTNNLRCGYITHMSEALAVSSRPYRCSSPPTFAHSKYPNKYPS